MNSVDLNFYCGVILTAIICFGVIGNILSVMVWMNGRNCRTYSSALYLIALALSDTCNLCFSAIVYAIQYLFQFSLFDVNEVFCKLLRSSGFFFTLLSTWLIVCVTIERTLAVRQPLNSIRWRSKRKTGILLLFLFFACALLTLPWVIGANILSVASNKHFQESIFDINSIQMDVDRAGSSDRKSFNETSIKDLKTCQFHPSSFIYRYEKLWRFWIIDFCLIFSVPLIILTTCNMMALIKICQHDTVLQSQERSSHILRKRSAAKAMTARVIAISMVHCVSVGPFCISVLIPSFEEAMNRNVGYVVWLYSVFDFIWYLNHGVNFILYSLFGTAFRRDCLALFSKKRSKEERTFTYSSPVKSCDSVIITLSVSSLQENV